METIISSRNIYVDTNRSPYNNPSRGDNFVINLNSIGLECGQGEQIRLTLQDFCMYKNWTDVNYNNSAFIYSNTGNTNILRLGLQNYSTIYDLATNFANTLGASIVANAGAAANGFEISALVPNSTSTISGTTDNIISFIITTTLSGVPSAHGLVNHKIQFLEGKGDTHALLGGDRISIGNNDLSPSITMTSTATTVSVFCLYPAQRSTSPHIYLRTSLETGALETNSLDNPTDQTFSHDVLGANILARIPVNTEICSYTASTERAFFVTLGQKNVSNIRIYLTDEHNRPIGRYLGDPSPTASGKGFAQSTLGNFTFSAVIRVEIVQVRLPAERFFPAPEIPINPKLSNVKLSP